MAVNPILLICVMLFHDALGALFNKSRIQEILIRGYAKSDFIYELEYKSLEYVSLKKKKKKKVFYAHQGCVYLKNADITN